MKSKLNSRKLVIFSMLMLITYSFSFSYWRQRNYLYENGQVALKPDGQMAVVLFILIPILVIVSYIFVPVIYRKLKKPGYKTDKNKG